MIIGCQVCGKEIETKIYWRKFCSDKCRLIAWARRQEDKKGDANEARC